MHRNFLLRAVACGLVAATTTGCVVSPRAVASTSAPVPTPKARLFQEANCALYAGSVAGNDTTMRLELLLCPSDQGVDGLAQFSSPVSGWSLRRVSGGVAPDGTLRLADVRMLEYHPSDDWRLCMVDRYDLTLERTDGGAYTGIATGAYASTACSDQARIAVQRVRKEP